MTTKFLNLDELVTEEEVVLILSGKEHPLKISTVAVFTTNMKAIEGLGVSSSILDEMEVTIGVILRAFPTLVRADIDGMTLPQLQAIRNFAQTNAGEVAEVVTDPTAQAAEAPAEGNVPAAS